MRYTANLGLRHDGDTVVGTTADPNPAARQRIPAGADDRRSALSLPFVETMVRTCSVTSGAADP